MQRAWFIAWCVVSGAAWFGVGACNGESGGAPGDPDAQARPDSSPDGSMRDSGDGDADAKPLGVPRVYVGSDDGKIRLYSFDTTTYALTLIEAFDAGQQPTFLAFDPTVRFLYAIDSRRAQVNAFRVEPGSGRLSPLQSGVPSGGQGPTHIAVDRAGKFVMVANYNGGTATIYPRESDGKLGTGVTRSFGNTARTHQIVTEPTNTFIFIPNLGLDTVAALRLSAPDFVDAGVAPSGDGPRHIDFDPQGKYAYVMDELGSTVSAFSLNTATGALSPIQRISSLPSGHSGSNTGAEIQVLPSGRQVIASNRGDDSLMVFDIDPGTGKLTQAQRVPTGGKTPRHFQVDATGRFLFVGNQGSNSVVVMKVDPSTGVPSPQGAPVNVSSPPGYVGLVYVDP